MERAYTLRMMDNLTCAKSNIVHDGHNSVHHLKKHILFWSPIYACASKELHLLCWLTIRAVYPRPIFSHIQSTTLTAAKLCWKINHIIQFLPTLKTAIRCDFYRAMHFSAKRGIAIPCRLSVRPSVCDVGELWSHRLEFFKNNFTIS